MELSSQSSSIVDPTHTGNGSNLSKRNVQAALAGRSLLDRPVSPPFPKASASESIEWGDEANDVLHADFASIIHPKSRAAHGIVRRTCADSAPKSRAAAAGRSILDRPVRTTAGHCMADWPDDDDLDRPIQPNVRRNIVSARGRSFPKRPSSFALERPPQSSPVRRSSDAAFTASAATKPIRRVTTDATLKSCLSSRGSMASLGRRASSEVGFGRGSANRNAAFEQQPAAPKPNVSFSHLRVREYEVTLGDNPSVSSGAPLSLGWNYNPEENVSNIPDPDVNDGAGSEPGRTRRSTSEFQLSERERYRRLLCNPDVSMHDVLATMRSNKLVRQERATSLKELKMEKMREAMLVVERKSMRRRRMGIVDGGLSVSESMLTL